MRPPPDSGLCVLKMQFTQPSTATSKLELPAGLVAPVELGVSRSHGMVFCMVISHNMRFSRCIVISHSRSAIPHSMAISHSGRVFVSGTRWSGDSWLGGSSIYMGCPPVLGSSFDSISFRVIVFFPRPPAPVSSSIFTPDIAEQALGVFLALTGLHMPLQVASPDVGTPQHICTRFQLFWSLYMMRGED